MNKNIAVQLINVSKEYVIHHEKPTLVEKFIKTAKFKRDEHFLAVKDVNLSIRKKEIVGITGLNGSGKTTLLKLINRICIPSRGKIITNGKVVSIIDLEAGFHPDLTGYHNIYLNGMLLGLTKKEINSKLNDIIAFADIKQFIDTPLFAYSEGMKLRLGFAIAIHTNADIILIDESVAVGDRSFIKKILIKVKELFTQGKTVIMVTQDLNFLRKNCSRIVIMEEGRIVSSYRL